MKKIILSLATLSLTISPIVVVVSCSSNTSVKEYEYMKKVVYAFDNSIGGKDINKEFTHLLEERDRIGKIINVDERTKESQKYFKSIFSALIAIEIGTKVNNLTYTTLQEDAITFQDYFQGVWAELNAIKTIEQAKDFGFKSLAEVTKAENNANKLLKVVVALQEEDNGIIIGQQLNENIKSLTTAFYQTNESVDVHEEFAEIKDRWNIIKNKPIDFVDLKSFIVDFGKSLAEKSFIGRPKNTFKQNTIDQDIVVFKEIFDKVGQVANSFTTDEQAIKYGFSSNNEALKAYQQTNYFSSVKKAITVAEEKVAIIISE